MLTAEPCTFSRTGLTKPVSAGRLARMLSGNGHNNTHMNPIKSLIILAFVLSSITRSQAEDRDDYIKCQIDGITNVFTVYPTAISPAKDGLHVYAFTDFRAKPEMLELRIPTPRLGPATLQTATNMTLAFSSIFSSSSDDSYLASIGSRGTSLRLTIKELGEPGKWIQGDFSGSAVNTAGKMVSITNGVFRIRRSVPIQESVRQNGTRPTPRANRE